MSLVLIFVLVPLDELKTSKETAGSCVRVIQAGLLKDVLPSLMLCWCELDHPSIPFTVNKVTREGWRAMADAPPGTPRRLARTSSSLGVWWKLGDTEVERRLRGIAEEEAAVRARMERRHAVRRKVELTSMSLEMVAFLYGLWRARRQGRAFFKLLLLPALAIPALATVFLAAFARFRKILDARDEQTLQRLAAERKANIGSFRGSYHNLQKLVDKYDHSDAADDKDISGASKKLERTHSRLSFHVGDE